MSGFVLFVEILHHILFMVSVVPYVLKMRKVYAGIVDGFPRLNVECRIYRVAGRRLLPLQLKIHSRLNVFLLLFFLFLFILSLRDRAHTHRNENARKKKRKKNE